MNWRNKVFIRTNKLYEVTTQICIFVEQNLRTHENKYLYIHNKLYELTEQIIDRG
jgi:hypothetical protein